MNRFILAILFVTSFTSISNAQKESESTESSIVRREHSKSYDFFFKAEPNKRTRWKNPAASFILSALIPGAGQMYNDQTYLGLGVFGAEAILIGTGVGFLKMTPYTKEVNNGYWWGYNYKTDRRYEYTGYGFIALGGALYIAQLIHAPVMSHRKNRANSFAMLSDRNDFEYDFKVAPTGTGMAMQLSF